MDHEDIGRRAILGMGLGITVACNRLPKPGSWRFFTDEEARTVDAICEQLIPRDRDPGAHDANVVNYIDIQLARRWRKYRRAYQDGIAAVDAASRSRFSKPFVALSPSEQIEILKEIEKTSPAFFDLILNHTRQGFYGDPRHGGNRNRVSWKMLGLPLPPVRGREHYH
jgi:gluconate 2-dehydrogenase gamma chain